jgi:hypothetical protein
VLVHADCQGEVAHACVDGVGGGEQEVAASGAAVEECGEGDAREPEMAVHGVGVHDLEAAAASGVDVLPTNARVVQRAARSLDAHVQRRDAIVAAEGVEPDPDDCDVHVDCLSAFAGRALA